jgi:hypothetical protein
LYHNVTLSEDAKVNVNVLHVKIFVRQGFFHSKRSNFSIAQKIHEVIYVFLQGAVSSPSHFAYPVSSVFKMAVLIIDDFDIFPSGQNPFQIWQQNLCLDVAFS